MRTSGLFAAALILSSGFLLRAGDGDCPAYPSSKWSFDPDALAQKAEFQMTMTSRLAASIPEEFRAAAAAPRQNFIDDHIFSRLDAEGVQPANLATDEEFIRRVSIDLTGRPSDPERVRLFLGDQSSNKKDRLIDELLNSDAFVDRWTFWLGEVLRNTSSAGGMSTRGRNALHFYLRDAIQNNVPYNQLVSELIRAEGGSLRNGPVNFIVRNYSPADPVQDTFDDYTANVMSTFLGIPSLCVSCHDGARHLEPINSYLAQRKRREFWQQAAFMSRMTITRVPINPLGGTEIEVVEKAAGAYATNTRGNAGQRPLRTGGPYTPVYMLTGERPRSGNYRAELARILTSDIQFARATANRVWAHLMTVGIVDPVDGFDPERYDAQASHPELLDALAKDFVDNGYNLRQLIRRITTSSAYQLSVRYPGTWQESYRRLYARKLVRPLEAEEIHDSILQATGMRPLYFVNGFDNPVTWAMQLPDTNEPQRDGTALAFLRIFGRGNRVDELRSSDSSILGSLSLMNSTFVTAKTTATGSTAVARLLQMQHTDGEIVDRLFSATLARNATSEEKQAALNRRGRNRTEWAEDLQWALLNKLDFLFNY